MKKKILAVMTTCMLVFGVAGQAAAVSLHLGTAVEGGDAASMATADAILDIAFAIDRSGSMQDEGSAISAAMQGIIANLDCPEIDCWVRASFYGINGTAWGIFNTALTASPVNHDEDNGPAVTALVNNDSLWSNSSDALVGQDYYRAVVTIGDEGTENGYSITQADWDAAYTANQAAITDDVFVFSLVGTVWPDYSWDEANRNAVFSAMAIGGSGGGHVYGDTGGGFYETTSETLETDIEAIICTAASGGGQVPEPGTLLLLGFGLIGMIGYKKK